MIATEQAVCKICGRPIIQKTGKGHRKREYCQDRACKQEAYRQRNAQQVRERIATLERENKELRARLDYEERFLTDTRQRDFKIWLRSHLQPTDSTFFSRFQDDRDMPTKASRAKYEGLLRLRGYSAEDIEFFRDAWKRMFFTQK